MSHGVAEKPPRVEPPRRILIGVAWGLVPVLFVGWLASDAEVPMGAWARALGIFQRVLMLGLAAALVASAGLFGMRLLRFARIVPESLFARFVLGAGVGLGALALVTLAFGCAGLIRPPFAACVFGAMLLAGIFELRPFGEWLRKTPKPRFARLSWLELALVFAMLLVFAFQTLLAFDLPTDYDACEYHMAAPWRWAQLGRIDWVEGNVYTNLPMNCEMLYLYSLALVGHSGPWPPAAGAALNIGSGWERLCLGVHLGVVMNMMTALLATSAVYVLARRFFSRRAAIVAAALFFTMPWTMIATTVFIHNEILLAFWATLAVYALMESLNGGTGIPACPGGDRQECLSHLSDGKAPASGHRACWLVLAAVFAGFAAGVKYTALGFFPVVGAGAAFFVFSTSPLKGEGRVRVKTCGVEGASGKPDDSTLTLPSPCPGEVETARRAGWAKRAGLALLYVAVVLVVVSPWFIKNAAFAGNPVFPFAYKWFGGRDWSAELDWKWYAGNMKAAAADQAGNLLVATWERVVWPRRQWGSAAIALFALLALVRWRDRRVRWLWVLLVLWTLLWYFGTHRVDRFWLPFAGVAAALAGCGFSFFFPSPLEGEGKGEGAASRPSKEKVPHPDPLPRGEGDGTGRRRAIGWMLAASLFLGLGWQLYVCSLNFATSAAGNYDLIKGNDGFLFRRYDLTMLFYYTSERRDSLDVGEEPRLLLVGEARSLYFKSREVICSTVFDKSRFSDALAEARDGDEVRRRLHAAKVTDVFVNWGEVGRLRESYSHVGKDGRVVPGLPPLSPISFQRLVDAGVLRPVGEPWLFPKPTRNLRGLTDDEMKSLPNGRAAMIYAVRPR